MDKDLSRIHRLLERAHREGRSFLLEPEVYVLFQTIGIKVPKFIFLPREKPFDPRVLKRLESEEVVLKVVSPLILHKTDVGGVRFLRNRPQEIKKGISTMLQEVPQRWLSWAQEKGLFIPDQRIPREEEVRKSIRGFLLIEKISYEKIGFGEELLFGLRHTREFGPVVTIGLGGVDVEYITPRLKEDQALGLFSAIFLKRKQLAFNLSRLAFYEKLIKGPRGGKPLLSPDKLIQVVDSLARLGRHFSSRKPGGKFLLDELEANPVVVRRGELIPLDGLARFSRKGEGRIKPPIELLDRLLYPRCIAIIGVSEKMNIGHIILNNILQEGFPPEKIYVIKPGLDSIEGCRCLPSVADLPETVDLFVYAMSAEQIYSFLKEVIDEERARSVIIIAGGLGEKAGTEERERKIQELLKEARNKGKLTPVVNGGNCLGIISRPGRYDTTFIPEFKFPRPRRGKPGLVFISQSGAFMITRMNKSSLIAPFLAISLGNQIDLTVSDYLRYFASRSPEGANIFAIYIEGLREGDGLDLAAAAARLIAAGKRVVVYKGGRTPEGQAATASHTASVAGDYPIFRAILEQTGVYVAETLAEFENAIRALFHLSGKNPRGFRVGLLSNAGFECVIMADSISPAGGLRLAKWAPETRRRLLAALSPLGIDRLQDIRNPLDLTPVADDSAFAACAEAVVDDPNVDCAVISPVPMTAALETLPAGPGHSEDFHRPGTLASRLIELFHHSPKPLVFNIDAGPLYDPLADYLEGAGLPVFRRVDEALLFLRKFVALSQKK